MDKRIALLSLIAVLMLVNWSIAGKEKHLAQGTVVYLELAPVDPRSLMQGDYMALRFRLADDVYRDLPKAEDSHRWRREVHAADGYMVVSLDEQDVAHYQGLHKGEALKGNELLMRYRIRNGSVKFATNAFFFQEGHEPIYRDARYGRFRVDPAGELLLVAMHDQELKELGPAE